VITADVLDIRLKEAALIGNYEFLQLPSPGDRICLAEMSGSLGLWEVKYTEHSPRDMRASRVVRPARATVFVEWLADVTPA
jgi:hypothetical protein